MLGGLPIRNRTPDSGWEYRAEWLGIRRQAYSPEWKSRGPSRGPEERVCWQPLHHVCVQDP